VAAGACACGDGEAVHLADDRFGEAVGLPGDAGTEIDRLACIFEILTTNYDAVVYCVGNHESWRRGTASGGSSLSPEKRTPETNRMLHLLQYSFLNLF
jgi:hypothetical protein